jgi:hypothetical protein
MGPRRAAPIRIPAAATSEAGALIPRFGLFPMERDEAIAELDMMIP